MPPIASAPPFIGHTGLACTLPFYIIVHEMRDTKYLRRTRMQRRGLDISALALTLRLSHLPPPPKSRGILLSLPPDFRKSASNTIALPRLWLGG